MRLRTVRILLPLSLILSLPLLVLRVPVSGAAEPASRPAPDTRRNVVLIGWDGCQREHLKEMLSRGELPNLAALAKDGALVDIQVTTGATDTKAGWSQILTGYRPETTGVYSNNRYRPIPAGLTIFERAEAAFGDDAVYTAMIVGKKGHVDAGAPVRTPYQQWLNRSARGANGNLRPAARLRRIGATVETEGARRFVVVPGKPYYLAQKGMDAFTNGLNTNARVGAKALEAIARNRDGRFLLFVHFARPDHDGHKSGENSADYSAGIREDDAWTGTLVRRLKDLGLYDSTMVCVVADHGFDEDKKTHAKAPTVFLATNDKAVAHGGDRADIAPTILARMGVDPAALIPPPDGKPLTD